jgi:hypothetical protein
MNSGLTRREIEEYASKQNRGGMRGQWAFIESARRNKRHPERQERYEYFLSSCVQIALGSLVSVLTISGISIAVYVVGYVVTVVIEPFLVRWGVPLAIIIFSIPTGIILAAILRSIALRVALSREILNQSCDNRMKIGQILIVSCQLSIRAELEIVLDDCLELREEQEISEFQCWFSFCRSSIAKVKRHRAPWLSAKRKRMAEQK